LGKIIYATQNIVFLKVDYVFAKKDIVDAPRAVDFSEK
jgi:hypothetical protein